MHTLTHSTSRHRGKKSSAATTARACAYRPKPAHSTTLAPRHRPPNPPCHGQHAAATVPAAMAANGGSMLRTSRPKHPASSPTHTPCCPRPRRPARGQKPSDPRTHRAAPHGHTAEPQRRATLQSRAAAVGTPRRHVLAAAAIQARCHRATATKQRRDAASRPCRRSLRRSGVRRAFVPPNCHAAQPTTPPSHNTLSTRRRPAEPHTTRNTCTPATEGGVSTRIESMPNERP